MRLPGESRERTKNYASTIIRLYIELPRSRKEVEVLGHQLLRSGTSVAAHTREASRARSIRSFVQRSTEHCKKLMSRICGLSSYATIAVFGVKLSRNCMWKLTN